MFGSSRRHRPPNPPLNSRTANPNAASAAATAFMSASNQNPGKSLSSAAAAAALRARPYTPTNVGEVQTKRTIRRSTSVSSTSSVPAATTSRPTAQLERKGSSGSMTERTFRSPSPHRTPSIQAAEERPPVPRIPTGHKKSSSVASPGVGMQTFRTASQKMKTGHPSWYTEPSGDPSNVRISDAPMRTGKPQVTIATPQRPDSRSSSVNFSYPTGFRPQSPPASPTSVQAPQFSSPPPHAPASPSRSNRASISSVTSAKSDRPMVYDPNSRRMVPKATADNVEYHIREAAGKHPRKKKTGGIQKEGSHSAKGTVARIRGSIIDADTGQRDLPKREQPVMEATPTTEESRILEESSVKAIITMSGKPGQDEPIRKQSLQLEDPQASRYQSPPPPEPAPTHRTTTSPASHASGKKPPVVQEESDDVAKQVDPVVRPSQKVLDALDAVPTRQSLYEPPETPQHSTQEATEMTKQDPLDDRPLKQDESLLEAAKDKKAAFVENKPVAELSREESSMRRSTSSSPARQAHFSTTPSDNLAVRHVPLPRSASPIKSALKRTSPAPREISPSDKSSDISGSRGASPHQGDETAAPRRKSVRVSFDDRSMATVVGEPSSPEDSDSPVPPSPQQAKRPWYNNIRRSKRREFTLEDDEIMGPRPALPSFGSVREKTTRELGERPLVRPYEPAYSPAVPSSPELRPTPPVTHGDAEAPGESPLGQSSDHTVGSILAQEQTSRNAPNISKFREPLPPVVTSVEGSGYISDSIRSSDSDDDLLDSIAGASDAEEIPSTQITQFDSRDNSLNSSAILEEKRPVEPEVGAPTTIHLPTQAIPEITIIQPSPKVPQQNTSTANLLENRYFDVPGGFPEDQSDGSYNSRATSRDIQKEATSDAFPSAIFEPKAAVHSAQPETLPQTTLATTTPLDAVDKESTDDSDTSIYSDACDYLSDDEGDGFLSLDAVVEKPINEITSPQIPELPGDTPIAVDVQRQIQVNGRPEESNTLLEPPREKDDWEQAKAFWRSLTAEKRIQLEREAVEEAGAEGDGEQTVHPILRISHKNTRQQQAATEPQPRTSTQPPEAAKSVNPERVHTTQSESKATHEPTRSPPASSRMRTSLRGAKPGDNTKPQPSDGMRKTMRSHTGTGQVSQPSLRQAPQRERPSAVAASRPNQRQDVKAPPQTSPPNKSGNKPDDRPALQHRESDASDSSFKRNRATRSGGFTLRTSMRPASVGSSHEATKGSGRFSLRSLSPTGSTFRQSSSANAMGGPPTSMMRRTLRSSSVSSQEKMLPSIHLPSFGRSSKAPSAKRSKKSSRFGDSSDEDEGVDPSFHSRFDDSSDEEGARPSSSSHGGLFSRGTLRASGTGAAGFRKSTPVPEVDEDSPELPDSDDEMPSPLQSPRKPAAGGGIGLVRSNSEALGTTTLTRSRSGRGGFATSVSMPTVPNKPRRGSLMGILRRNKRADQTSKIQRGELIESAARRDTKLERSNGQLKDLRGDHPSSPKLQKRASVRRNDSWPLPEPAEGETMKRSSSAGNLLDQSSAVAAVERPGLNARRSTSLGITPTAYDNQLGDTTMDGLGQRKKKKFGALRRMFGLDV